MAALKLPFLRKAKPCETEDGELSVSSVIEGSQFLMGNNVKAKRLMGKNVYVETCYDPPLPARIAGTNAMSIV